MILVVLQQKCWTCKWLFLKSRQSILVFWSMNMVFIYFGLWFLLSIGKFSVNTSSLFCSIYNQMSVFTAVTSSILNFFYKLLKSLFFVLNLYTVIFLNILVLSVWLYGFGEQISLWWSMWIRYLLTATVRSFLSSIVVCVFLCYCTDLNCRCSAKQ